MSNEFIRKKPASHKKAQARNRVAPKESSKASPIKLFLSKQKDVRTAIRYALDNSYRWTPFNIHEIRKYMKYVEANLNPVTFDILSASNSYVRPEIYMRRYQFRTPAKYIYKHAGLPWNTPPYFPRLKSLNYGKYHGPDQSYARKTLQSKNGSKPLIWNSPRYLKPMPIS